MGDLGTILIVEDEETLRTSLQRVLTREGYDVESAGSSEAALSILDSRRPDVIISDIILPGMDGLEFMKLCREKNQGAPVIIMTAFASIESAVCAMKAGAYDYLVKPIMHEQVKGVISRALRQRKG
jgi:DNA-binding NtrC family response regulator